METDPESEDGVGTEADPIGTANHEGRRCSRDWEARVEEAKKLAFDDSRLESDLTVTGVDGLQEPASSLWDEATGSPPPTLMRSAMPASPMDHMSILIEVHVSEEDLKNL